MRRTRVSTVGETLPDSMAEMAGWLVPAFSANSAWESRLIVRANFNNPLEYSSVAMVTNYIVFNIFWDHETIPPKSDWNCRELL